jgi:hypothetical protein
MPTSSAAGQPGELVRLAETRFAPLREAELKLLRAVPFGEVAGCGSNQKDFEPGNDPAKASAWSNDRSIRAALIRWLCIDRQARKYVDPRGVQVHGARIEGALELSFTLNWGRLLFGFQRLQVLFGWILATLFVAGVTGIVQKH